MSRLGRSFISQLAALAATGAFAASVEVQVRDAAGQPVADAAVFATPASGPVEVKGARIAEIAQADREFLPYVSVIQTGTQVAFPNRDHILHHVYSFSQAKPFEIKLYSSAKSPTEVFDKAGVVTLGCNIHDWMIAYVRVVSTPHFAKTDASGTARLRDLPAGGYDLEAWHPQQRAAAAAQPIALEATTQRGAAFTLDIAARKAKFKPPLDRQRY